MALMAMPGAVFSQRAGKVWRVGVLAHFDEGPRFLIPRALSELGYETGRNVVFDFQSAHGNAELMPAMVAKLLAAKPDLLIGTNNREVKALKDATSTIPIVAMYVVAPVESGLVSSLARPGGNITGTTINAPESAGKRIQILHETVPRMSRVAWLNEPDFPGFNLYTESVHQAMATLRLTGVDLAVRTIADLDAALGSLERNRPHAISVAGTGVLLDQTARIIEFAARHKLPAIYSAPAAVGQGGLMNYTANVSALAGRNAWMIDKIFKGARPSEIPMEEPAKFQLRINLKTAKAMGLAIPQGVLLQATELIE
jgi:putative ABC transport system substrate-binding protein